MSTTFDIRRWATQAGIQTTGGFAVIAECVTMDELQRFAEIAIASAGGVQALSAAPPALPPYPPLPMQFACSGVFAVYSADQMRAYVDADRAARAPADSVAAPAIGDELRDTLVAVSAAIAERDDRAAQKMICEILAASPTPPAEQQAPRCSYCDGTGDVHGIDGEWRGICTECDAGTALRQQAAPKAAPWEQNAVSAEWLEQAAPQQEAQEPVAWQGVHDQTDLYYTKPLQADVRPLYAAPQPAPAELERLRERISKMGLDVDRAMRGHVNEQSPLGTTRLAAIAALAKPAPAPLSDDVLRDAAFEAVRKNLCALPRYSFALDDDGLIRRVQDRVGNWIEFNEAHALFDPVSVDAARKQGVNHD